MRGRTQEEGARHAASASLPTSFKQMSRFWWGLELQSGCPSFILLLLCLGESMVLNEGPVSSLAAQAAWRRRDAEEVVVAVLLLLLRTVRSAKGERGLPTRTQRQRSAFHAAHRHVGRTKRIEVHTASFAKEEESFCLQTSTLVRAVRMSSSTCGVVTLALGDMSASTSTFSRTASAGKPSPGPSSIGILRVFTLGTRVHVC